MKTLTIALMGASKYYSHPGLIQAIKAVAGWDEAKVTEFIKTNDTINLSKQSGESAKDFLGTLENSGFELNVSETKLGVSVTLNVSYENEVHQIREQVATLVKRLDKLEGDQVERQYAAPLATTSAYVTLIDKKVGLRRAMGGATAAVGAESQPTPKKGTAEANIGQYWLSRIGIFTLLLGVVFLISYTSQFTGALGKLLIGALVGSVLVGGGNMLAAKKDYFKWAMAAIGGGWAILYFTVFAAHHVPLVKVIHNPLVGLVLLMVVSMFSISQSLQYRSYVLVIMSYLLAFIAMITTNVTFYTLFASIMLAGSMLIVTRKLGWSWVACLGLVIVYGTHWVWLEPAISLSSQYLAGQSQEHLFDALYLPFAGDQWRIYPVIDLQKSLLHLAFLTVYWVLFVAMDMSQPAKIREVDKVTPWMAIANSLIYTMSGIHHLHVYYPGMKYVFVATMAALFFVYFQRERHVGRHFIGDVYLGMSVSLGCLVIPMYFNGAWVTCGWAAASACIVWLSIKGNRVVLRGIAGVFSTLVVWRLIHFDYLERVNLFGELVIYPFFFTAFFAAISFVLIYRLYQRLVDADESEVRVVSNVAGILAPTVCAIAFLMGGQREIASFIAMVAGGLLMLLGVVTNQKPQRICGGILLLGATVRYLCVDFGVKFEDVALANLPLIRYVGGALSIGILLYLAEKVRGHKLLEAFEAKYFAIAAIMAGFMYLTLVADPLTDSYRSILWGMGAFAFLLFGFGKKERVYRWVGLGGFVCVLAQLFLYDFANLEMIYRILSFMGLGIVLIVASLVYAHYAKTLLSQPEN